LGIVYIHFEVLREGQRVPVSFFESWPEFFELAEVTYWDELTRRMVQLCPRDPLAAAALLRGALADLLGCSSLDEGPGRGTASPHHDRIGEIAARLSLETEGIPSVQNLAQEAGLSPAHFGRLFRAHTGQTPKEFLLRVRMTRAQYFLRETDMSISEIAERLGYADVFFFSRQFKQKNGLSPSRFRKRQ
jgi:AraC-like DNA-binding protein